MSNYTVEDFLAYCYLARASKRDRRWTESVVFPIAIQIAQGTKFALAPIILGVSLCTTR